MQIQPMDEKGDLVIEGKVFVNHHHENYPTVHRAVGLKITIPDNYPNEPPCFEETSGIIPRTGEYHINPDNSLCLGSPFHVAKELKSNPDLNRFYEYFFMPYIYAVLLKIEEGIDFIFGELSHGNKGEVEDLLSEFGVSTQEQVLSCLKALSQKKRISNKKPCPCDCGQRLGKCKTHKTLNKFRAILPRGWYRHGHHRLSMPQRKKNMYGGIK